MFKRCHCNSPHTPTPPRSEAMERSTGVYYPDLKILGERKPFQYRCTFSGSEGPSAVTARVVRALSIGW